MRILIIEDEIETADFLKKTLSSICFVAETANDGLTGLNMAMDFHYDLVVLDNMLPQKTGLEICKEIRNQGKTMPILMLSVMFDTEFKIKALEAGADDFLTKPYGTGEFIARVHALLRRPLRIHDNILTVDDLTLDRNRLIVKRSKKEIDFTRKEFMLLEFLMDNVNAVVSRVMILDKVWDSNIDLFSNTIESHMVSLRKKIDKPGLKKLIHTVSGRGYKIACRE